MSTTDTQTLDRKDTQAMPKITFIEHDGAQHTVEAEIGSTVMDGTSIGATTAAPSSDGNSASSGPAGRLLSDTSQANASRSAGSNCTVPGFDGRRSTAAARR